MRRLKNGMTSWFEPEAERENVAALEKERALLGKEQRKPRQVRPARVDLGFGEVGIDRGRGEHVGAEPLRHVEARLKLAVDVGADGAGMPPPVVTAGRTLRPRPRSKSGSSVSSPARLVCVTWYCRAGDAQRSVSSRRWIRRCTLKCHSRRSRLEAERLHGNPISALQPVASRCVAASQMPSQSGLSLSPPARSARRTARRWD